MKTAFLCHFWLEKDFKVWIPCLPCGVWSDVLPEIPATGDSMNVIPWVKQGVWTLLETFKIGRLCLPSLTKCNESLVDSVTYYTITGTICKNFLPFWTFKIVWACQNVIQLLSHWILISSEGQSGFWFPLTTHFGNLMELLTYQCVSSVI